TIQSTVTSCPGQTPSHAGGCWSVPVMVDSYLRNWEAEKSRSVPFTVRCIWRDASMGVRVCRSPRAEYGGTPTPLSDSTVLDQSVLSVIPSSPPSCRPSPSWSRLGGTHRTGPCTHPCCLAPDSHRRACRT